jgi:ferritin
MLKVNVKKGNIERALKELKSKFIKTKVAKQCRENGEFTKPSVTKRAQKIKATYFKNQSEEERTHMLLLVDYLLEKDALPTLPQYNFMEEKEDSFDVLLHFQNSLENERLVTNSINKIVAKCKEVGDYTTENFMQWFVTEQREEEAKFKNIIDDLTIVGNDGVGLYKINKELGSNIVEED